MLAEFAVRVDFDARRMSIICDGCRNALTVDLGEPGVTRILALFASNHRHGEPLAPVLELREVPAAGDSGI